MQERTQPDNERFAVDERRVVHERVDGEVIIIQLESGHYYSLGGSGPEVWDLVVRGHTPREAAETIASRCGADVEPVAEAVERLVGELRAERLIAPNGSATPDPRSGSAANGDDLHERFAEPVLERYTDMRDYLLIDPIHEVEAAGWPDVKRA